MNKNILAIGIVIMFIFMSVIPSTATNVEVNKSSSMPLDGNILYVDGSRPKCLFKIPDIIDNQYFLSAKLFNGWDIETVDSEGNVGEYSSIALDSNNNPHISYHDGANLDLKYAQKMGSNWTIEIVESEYNCGWAGSKRSIAIDSDDNPHLVYIKWITGSLLKLRYAKWTGSEWEISTITETNNEETPGIYPSIALDSDDNPHIAYIYEKAPFNQNGAGVKYTRWNGTGWEFETVAESCPQYSTTDTTLVLDSEDNPHICYYHAFESLRYAKRIENGWSIETVDDGTCWFSCIAVDLTNQPHISYCILSDIINSDYDLKYAWRSQSGWNNIVLDIGYNFHTSLAIDENNYPRISYFGEYTSGAALKHAWWNGSKWVFTVVDYGDYEDTGLYTSTAIDSLGRTHISYYDWPKPGMKGNLKYACGDNTPPDNTPPNPPSISGPIDGKVGESHNYRFVSTDPDGDDVYYFVDWNDTRSWYSDRCRSGQEVGVGHTWHEQGTYTIKAKAIDFYNAESDWGTLTVTMPRNKIVNRPFLNFLENHPNSFPILRQLLRP